MGAEGCGCDEKGLGVRGPSPVQQGWEKVADRPDEGSLVQPPQKQNGRALARPLPFKSAAELTPP